MTLITITDDNYDVFKKYQKSVIVVGASWCSPCNEYKTLLKAFSKSYPDLPIGVAILDKGHLIKLKKEYKDIETWSVPTTILFRDGKEIERQSGTMGLESLEELIKRTFLNL